MCRITEILERSALLGPVIRLACQPISAVQAGIRQSGILMPLKKMRRVVSISSGWMTALNLLFLTNLVLLLLSLSFLDTGPIGLLTWSLLVLSCFTVFFRKDIAWLEQLTVIDLFVLAFVASACVSTGFSSYLKYSVIGLAKMSTFLAGYTSFRVLSVTQEGKRAFINNLALLLTAIGLGQSLIGLYQFFNHVDARATWVDPTINAELNLTRIFGTLKPSNPNLLAGFLIPCLVASLGLIHWRLGYLVNLMSSSGSRKLILPQLSIALACVVTVLVIVVAMVLTGSRGGFLALGGIALTFFGLWGHLLWSPSTASDNIPPNQSVSSSFSSKTLKSFWLILGILALTTCVGVIVASPQIRQRVGSIFAMRSDSSISYRFNVYNSVARMIQDNPLVGIGPGNDTFKRVYGYYMVPGFNALGAYSVPLEIAAEQGMVGLLIFGALFVLLLVRCFYFLETDRPLHEKMTVLALAAGIVASLFYGVFDTIWYRPSVNLLFWLYVALLAQMTRLLERRCRGVAAVSSLPV